MTTKAPSEDSSEAWKSFLWTIPVVVFVSICLCCLLVYARFRDRLLGYVHRKMPWLIKPRKKNLVTASDPTFDSPSPKGAESLRHRLPSPKAHEAGSPPAAPPMPGQMNVLRASAAQTEVPVPRHEAALPRGWIVRGKSAADGRRRGGRGSSKRDEDEESWDDDAATPPGSSERSSSRSSSRSSASSGSSESSLEPAHPPVYRGKVEVVKPPLDTGTSAGAGDGGPHMRAAVDNNSASCSNSTGTPRGARADPAEPPPSGVAEGTVHQAAAAAPGAAEPAAAEPPAAQSTELQDGAPPAGPAPELLT